MPPPPRDARCGHEPARGTTRSDVEEFEHGLRGDEAKRFLDDAGDFVGSSYVFATARDFAKFGELYRHDGVTEAGTRILPTGWVDHARTPISHDDENGCDYGRQWWMWPEIPGSLACHGHEGQYIVVAPDRDLVVVHLGKTDASAAPTLRARLRAMIDVC